MVYHYQKCCFASEKVGVINECDRATCLLNIKHEFWKYYYEKNDEIESSLANTGIVLEKTEEFFVLKNVTSVKFVRHLTKLLKDCKIPIFLCQIRININLFCGEYFLRNKK